MLQFDSTTQANHPRMRLWLAKLKPNIRKSLLKLFGQPRTCGKATNEERELYESDQEGFTR